MKRPCDTCAIATCKLKGLRGTSKQWSSERWEAYLVQLETPLREKLVRNFTWVAEEFGGVAPNYLYGEENGDAPPILKPDVRLVRALLGILSPKEYQAIKCLFWKELSGQQAAKLMGISRRSVRVLASRAVTKMRLALSPDLPIRGDSGPISRHAKPRKARFQDRSISGCSQFVEIKMESPDGR